MEVAGLRQNVGDRKRRASAIARCTRNLSLVQEEWDSNQFPGLEWKLVFRPCIRRTSTPVWTARRQCDGDTFDENSQSREGS